MTDYDLNPTDMKRLEDAAERISGPIVELVAVLAGERDAAMDALITAQGQANDWGKALVDAEALLKGTGYAPTFALDRDAYANVVIQATEAALTLGTQVGGPS